MTEKVKHALYTASNAALLAGAIIFITGAYYTVIKAGIPYQDPPLELQTQSEIPAGMGYYLLRFVFFPLLYGASSRPMLLVRHSRTRR